MAPVNAAQQTSTKCVIQVFVLYSVVTKSEIEEFFGQVAPVLSVEISGLFDSKLCLGSVLVTYRNKEEAINARDSLNSKSLKGLTVTIVLARPEGIQTNGSGDIFVKNLDATIDSEYLHKVFSAFGTTLSCKVATDRRGRSKGYGFVRFEKEKDAQYAIETMDLVRYATNTGGLYGHCRATGFVTFEIEEEAARAVEELNGYIHDDKTWKVERAWTEKLERKAASTSNVNDEKLKELFSQFGRITSCKVILYSHGWNRGFGFVAFSSPEAASKAVNELNGRMIGSKPLYVAVSQCKGERKSKLQKGRRGGIPQVMPPVELPLHNANQDDMPNSCVSLHNWTSVPANFTDASWITV
ncbi:Polyadenylate-binding protein 4 [Ranunculus cassubicifolius]